MVESMRLYVAPEIFTTFDHPVIGMVAARDTSNQGTGGNWKTHIQSLLVFLAMNLKRLTHALIPVKTRLLILSRLSSPAFWGHRESMAPDLWRRPRNNRFSGGLFFYSLIIVFGLPTSDIQHEFSLRRGIEPKGWKF